MGTGALELKRLEALARAFRLLAPLECREEVYRKTVGVLKESTRAASALPFLYRPEGDVLELVAAAGLSAERVGFRLRRGQGVSWRVLEEERAREELRAQAGKGLDPRPVPAFLEIV